MIIPLLVARDEEDHGPVVLRDRMFALIETAVEHAGRPVPACLPGEMSACLKEQFGEAKGTVRILPLWEKPRDGFVLMAGVLEHAGILARSPTGVPGLVVFDDRVRGAWVRSSELERLAQPAVTSRNGDQGRHKRF